MESKRQFYGKTISALLIEDNLRDFSSNELFSWIHKLKINARV